MNADIKTLEAILSRQEIERYALPKYQREFTWEEEVRELWDDLMSDFRNGKGKKKRVKFFLGTLLFAKKGAKEEIIDGQQRMTVIFSLLWIIYNKIKEKTGKRNKITAEQIKRVLQTAAGKERFKVAQRDESIFHKIKTGEPITESEKALGIAGANIGRWVDDELEGRKLNDFVKYFLTNVECALIETDGYARAWQLFIGLNAKGAPLVPSDIVKAYICGVPHDQGDNPAEIWEEKMIPLGPEATSSLVDLTRCKTGKRVRDAQLFDQFQEIWGKKIVNLNEVGDTGDIYSQFWKVGYEDLSRQYKGFNAKKKRALKIIRRIDRRDFNPIIIALGLKLGLPLLFSSEENEKLLRLIEAIEIRMAVAGKRNREQEFAAISHSVEKVRKPQISNILKQIEEKIIKHFVPSDEEFAKDVAKLTYRQKITRKLLVTLEEGERGDKIIENFEIEHIMPQNPDNKEYWFEKAKAENEDAYELLKNNIGNLAPIDKLTNIEARNARWSQKRAAYRKLEGWELNKIGEKHDTWDKESISKRAKEIASRAKKRWRLRV